MHFVQRRRETDARRPSGTRRGYTKKWAEFQKNFLLQHPRCECDECLALPEWQRPVATDVDHIDGCGRTGARAYDPTNLKALSHSHHSRKTVRHDGGFGRPVERSES